MLRKYVANRAQSKCFNDHLARGARRAQRRAVHCAMCPMWVQRRDKPINSNAAAHGRKNGALVASDKQTILMQGARALKVHCSLVSEHKDRCNCGGVGECTLHTLTRLRVVQSAMQIRDSQSMDRNSKDPRHSKQPADVPASSASCTRQLLSQLWSCSTLHTVLHRWPGGCLTHIHTHSMNVRH